MYKLCRLLLIIAVLELFVAFGLLLLMCWPIAVIVAAVVCWVRQTQPAVDLTAFGTARWACDNDLRQRGMVGNPRGLAIGRLCDGAKPKPLENVWPLFNRRLDDQTACNWSLRKRRKHRGEVVRLARSVHVAVFAPTGKGKGTSLIVPWLLESTENQFVVDFKGELAALTARFREQRLGHRTVLLDPFHVFTQTPDTFNPLDFIDPNAWEMMDECRDLAAQLVVKSPEEREPHWSETAETFIAAAITAVVVYGEPGNRSLQTVRDILANPQQVTNLIKVLSQSEGMLPRLGGQLAHFIDRELASTLTTANRHLRFLDTPAVYDSTSSSSFNPSDLRSDKRVTIYAILPPHFMRTQSALLRMWCGSMLRAVVRKGLANV